MKITLDEYDHAFDVEITPDTVAEAALLVRLGMNATKELIYISTTASREGTVRANVGVKKMKRASSQVKRGRW